MRPIILLFAVFLALGPLSTQARERVFVDEPSSDRTDVEDGELWAEGGVKLPSYPDKADLLEFQVDDPQERFRYFIDGSTLSVGDDQVVRYSLVIRSPTGAENVSFEGMRCNAREFKIYAYGSGRGEFKPLKAPLWERVKLRGSRNYHLSLRMLYFCIPEQYEPYDAKEIVRLLSETPRRVDDLDRDTGFY